MNLNRTKMDAKELQLLEQSHNRFYSLHSQLERAKNQMERKELKKEIDDLKVEMISMYRLMAFVPIINAQKSNNAYFDFDVKEIIETVRKAHKLLE